MVAGNCYNVSGIFYYESFGFGFSSLLSHSFCLEISSFSLSVYSAADPLEIPNICFMVSSHPQPFPTLPVWALECECSSSGLAE